MANCFENLEKEELRSNPFRAGATTEEFSGLIPQIFAVCRDGRCVRIFVGPIRKCQD